MVGLLGAFVGLLVGPLGGGVGFSVDGANDHDGEADGFGVLDGATVGVVVGVAGIRKCINKKNKNHNRLLVNYLCYLEPKRLLEIKLVNTKELNLGSLLTN